MIFGAIFALVAASALPVLRSFAAAPENTGLFGDLQIGGNVVSMEDITNGNEVNFDFGDNNKVTVTGAGLYSYEQQNGYHVAGNGNVTVTATAGEGYNAILRRDGAPLESTTVEAYLENSHPVRIDGEFSPSGGDHPDDPDDPGAPGNTTATFNYTYTGSAWAEWLVNDRFIDVGRYLPEDSHSTEFEETYDTNDGDTTVTFTFQTLFIDAIDDLTINGHSYNEFLPAGKDALAEHYDGHQHIAFYVTVDKADTYNISTRTHSLSEEEMFMGNFLWDNDTSLLDDPTLPDEARDDIIGHGTLEFVKAIYDGATYNSVEELNAAGNLFFFENNNTEGNTDGAMTLPIDTELTLSLIPEPGYQLVSFGINGGNFEPQENIGEYTFTIRGGNGHLAANFEAVDDAVAANADAVESGSIVLGGDEESMNIGTARLDVDDVELSSEEIDGFEDAADGYDISTYLDISLYNTIYKGSETDSWDTEVTELDHEAIITLKLEEGVDGNEVVIVHQKHDGTYEVIPTTYDPVAHTITFKTSSFSNYAIASRTVATPDTGTTISQEAGSTVAITTEIAIMTLLAVSATVFIAKRAKRK